MRKRKEEMREGSLSLSAAVWVEAAEPEERRTVKGLESLWEGERATNACGDAEEAAQKRTRVKQRSTWRCGPDKASHATSVHAHWTGGHNSMEERQGASTVQ